MGGFGRERSTCARYPNPHLSRDKAAAKMGHPANQSITYQSLGLEEGVELGRTTYERDNQLGAIPQYGAS